MPATVVGAAGFNRLVATTIEKRHTQIVDQVTRNKPLLAMLRKNLNAKGMSGSQLVLPLIGAELNATTTTDKSGTFSFAESRNIVGSAKYDASDPIVTNTRLNWKEIQQNAGKEGLIKLAPTYAQAAVRDHERGLVARFYAQTPAAGDPESLYTLISATATVGSIDPSVHTYWTSTVVNYDPASVSILDAFRELVDGVAERQNDDDMAGKVLLAGKNVYADYRAHFDGEKRYQTVAQQVGDVEFKGLEYDGIPVIRDFDCDADVAFLIDEKDLWLNDLNGQFITPQGEYDVTVNDGGEIKGTLDKATVIATSCALGLSSRRSHGRLNRVV